MNKPIRILFHLDCMAIGGLEKKVTQLALRLDRTRFEPIVSYSMELTDSGACEGELRRAGVPVVRIVPCAARRAGVVKAIRQIRDLAPEIFHTFSCRQNASDVQVAHRARVPVILTGRDNVRHWTPKGPARNWEFDRNRVTHFVTPCCEAAGELCRKLEGMRTEKIVVVPNGVELPEVDLACERGGPVFVVGYAAKYRRLKAHENLLRAFRKIVNRRPEARLICCGEDDAGRMEQLRELAASLSLEQHVTITGPCPDMDAFYRGLDLYVHPSSSEGLSMAILEAMSYALPVVATRVGGTPEAVVDRVTGILVPAQDFDALAAAVSGLMDRPDARNRMGTAGRERVAECFSVTRMVNAFEALYVTAVEGPGTGIAPKDEAMFTGTADCSALIDTTIFVTTIGDKANFEDCVAHLRAQTVRCRIEVIDHVAPMSAAFARMHELCRTPYYVQVDEDMLLYPAALEKLHAMMEQSPADVALVCAPLWDGDVERPIQGVKIYRHAVVKRFPYENTLSCEVKQLDQIYAGGYQALLLPAEDDAECLGEHGRHYTPETIFRRWQRLFHKRNALGRPLWLEPWPERLMERYATTRDPLHLYAALGAIAGIAGRADPNRELDWRDVDPVLQRMKYYFPVCPDLRQ